MPKLVGVLEMVHAPLPVVWIGGSDARSSLEEVAADKVEEKGDADTPKPLVAPGRGTDATGNRSGSKDSFVEPQ